LSENNLGRTYFFDGLIQASRPHAQVMVPDEFSVALGHGFIEAAAETIATKCRELRP